MVFSEKFEEMPIFYFQNGQLIMTFGKRLQRESWLTVLEIAHFYFDFILAQKKSQNLRKFETRILTVAQFGFIVVTHKNQFNKYICKIFDLFTKIQKIISDNGQ